MVPEVPERAPGGPTYESFVESAMMHYIALRT